MPGTGSGTDTDYPPEPWYLGGSLLVSAFLVPFAQLPAGSIPRGRRPIRWRGKVLVGAAFAQYVAGGVLDYNELLIAAPSLGGPRVTIPQIWVDSPASMAGGRALWGIPKQLAEFQRIDTAEGAAVSMGAVSMGAVSMHPAASLRATYGRRLLPGMRQVPLTTMQSLNGRRTIAHNRVVGRISALRTTWTFDPAGPLGYLDGRQPLFSVAVRDASIIFGMDVKRS